jgi:2',3'-cyclic-nucleotide 2'-phosphodiesterase (5'-nucleotidase family)
VPITDADREAYEGKTEAMMAVVHKIATELPGLTAILLNGIVSDKMEPYTVKSWHGNDVLMVPTGEELGKHLTVTTLHLHAATPGTAHNAAATRKNNNSKNNTANNSSNATWSSVQVVLDCSVANNPVVQEQQIQFHKEMVKVQTSTVYGYVDHTYLGLSMQHAAGAADVCSAGAITKLNDDNQTEVCGCRVAQCEAGRLVADGLRFSTRSEIGFYNAGGIRGDLTGGKVTPLALLGMLPFEDEVVQLVDVPGSVVWDAVANGISELEDTDQILIEGDPGGRFLQYSSSMHVEWYFNNGAPTVQSIAIARAATATACRTSKDCAMDGTCTKGACVLFEPIDLDGVYSVGTTGFLAVGNDGCGARFRQKRTSRMPLIPTPARLKLLHACDQ